eukprot:GHVR01110633.1.p1 GENE.GHVR01110633.1~~GHVR01110633.1.p1  ORF type:complete len:130 (-),score=17.63 GHVR01110633.1:41-385(-)
MSVNIAPLGSSYIKNDTLSNVTMVTSMGDIDIELYHQHAPITCRNFHTLASRGYYDGCLFHRIIKDFMIQGGDPTGTGKGGESIYGKYFQDEFNPELRHTGAVHTLMHPNSLLP